MFKVFLIHVFLLLAIAPAFAIIEAKDTAVTPVCDTIIDKDGLATPVRIISNTGFVISFSPCSDSKKILYVKKEEIREVISANPKLSFVRKTKPILTRAKRALRSAAISLAVLVTSFLVVIRQFEGDGNESEFGLVEAIFLLLLLAFFLSPFVFFGLLIYNLGLMSEAKKIGNKEAYDKALGAFLLSILPFLIIFLIIIL